MRTTSFKTFLLAITLSIGAQAAALVQYELTGKLGTEVSDPATFAATGLTAFDLIRGAGLTPAAGSNSMNASGWDDLSPADFFSFGFTVQPGFSAVLNEIRLSARSSATAPGFMNVLISKDGGPETLLATLTLPNAAFLDTDLSFSNVTIDSSATIFLRPANSTAANGGTIGSAGTSRISDYSPDNGASFEPVALLGTVNAVTATPEPSTAALSLAALTFLVRAGYRRKRRTGLQQG
jgi:hypothetical protein